MAVKKDLEYYLAQARRIAEHREENAEKEIRKLYKSMLKDLQSFVADVYVKYAEDDKLTFALLQKAGYDARFLEEIEGRISVASPKAARELHKLVEETYTIAYDGMVDAVLKGGNLDEAFAEAVAITPQQIKKIVKNPLMDIALEKNHRDIIYDIKRVVAVGLMNGDRYTTMAGRISTLLDNDKGPYKRACMIARTESHRVIEAGNHDASVEVDNELKNGDSGLRMCKTWKTMRDNRVRPNRVWKTKKGWRSAMGSGPDHMKMEGQTVLADEDFILQPEGKKAPCPGSTGIAGHDINCRCYVSYELLTDAEYFKKTGKHFPGYKGEQESGTAASKKKKDATESKQETSSSSPQMALENYPDAFTTGAEKKNTQKFVQYVNGLDGANPDTIRLYNSMGRLESISSEGIPFRISHGKNHAVQSTMRISDGDLVEVKLIIPKLDGDNLAGQIQTTLHEKMHLIDMYCRTDTKKAGGWFSASRKPLADVFKRTTQDMSDEVAGLFKQFEREYTSTREAVYKAYIQKRDALRESFFPNGASIWSDIPKYRQYEKEAKKLEKWYEAELDYQCRNIMGGGVNTLQDIYDALSGGIFRDKGIVKYGHGSKYYRSNDRRVEETLANYGALSVTRPDLVEMLRADKPDLVAELEATVKEMLKRAGV